jgi:hypothetical protein
MPAQSITPPPSPVAVPDRQEPVPHTVPEPAAVPPLADAFAAILEAEQHEPMPDVMPAWPTVRPSDGGHAGNGVGPLTEELIEEITRRVLDQLSDRVMRERVTELVTDIAERLVREEIERIKASMQ